MHRISLGVVLALALVGLLRAESPPPGESDSDSAQLELLACARADETSPAPFDPTGRWVMTLPAGWQRKVTLTRASDSTWLFEGAPALLHNGVYELNLETETLAMIEANDPSQIAYEWRILNANTLQLVRQDTPSGGNYVGATLSRDFDWDELVDNSPVPTVGTLSHGRR